MREVTLLTMVASSRGDDMVLTDAELSMNLELT